MLNKIILANPALLSYISSPSATGAPNPSVDSGIILSHKERSVIIMDEWQEDKEIKSANPRDQFTWEDVNIYI
jgi:hypothetical protein